MKPPLPFARPLLLLSFFQRWITPASLPVVLAVTASLAILPCGYALPNGGQVIAGDVGITQLGNTLNVTQGSRYAVVNWQGFNIAPNELVRVLQSGADAAMLARVTGGDPSLLLGALKADGKLFLINPKGIIVGAGATIDTAAFIASTLDVADADFLRGAALTFKGDSAAGVVNLGKITAREGNVFLLAHTVKNAGEISAPKGTAGLAAGTEVYLAAPDAPTFVIKTNLATTTEKTGVENSGIINAAQAELKAAGGSIYDLAVNQSGFMSATGVEHRDGRVILTASGGNVSVTGSVAARNADGSGGEILVGGDYRGGNTTVPNAARTYVGATAILNASATSATGSGGRVIVWSDEGTRFNGTLEAKAGAQGGNGGFAEVSGKHQLDFNPTVAVDLSAAHGERGTLLLDPDALVISTAANASTATSGANPFVFSAAATPATLNVTTLQNQLANSNVTLDTSTSAGDVTFANAVTWSSNNTLRVNAGNNINLNANITGGATSTLALYAGKAGLDTLQQGNDTQGKIEQAIGSTISVGTLTVGMNAVANVPANNGTAAGNVNLAGVLNVSTLQADLAGTIGNLVANNSSNAIGKLATTGSGGGLSQIDVVDGSGNLDVQLSLAGSSAFEIQIVTAGALTLLAGTTMTFTSQANVILASTGGAFSNNAGASAIGANGRFLIYSNASGTTVKNGLVGTDVFSRTYAGNPPGDFSGDSISRFLFSASGASLPQLTYRSDDKARAYGDANPTLTFGVTGYQLGVTNDVTGSPALSATATQSSGVGAYTINIAQGSLASFNYTFTFVPGTLTVQTAPVTVAVTSTSRFYGDANSGFTLSVSGLKMGETFSSLGGFTFSTAATALSNVGIYVISATPSGGGSSNYSFVGVGDGALTIKKAPLTVALSTAFSRTYGASNPNFLTGVVLTGLKNDLNAVDALAFATAATTASSIGTYAVTASATSTNYDLTFVPGSLAVTKALLTIRADDLFRLFGDANPAFTATTTGLLSGDTTAVYSGLSFATSATTSSNVGTYTIVPSGATAANYAISYAPGALTVNKAPLTAVIANASRTYTQDNPGFTLASVTGLKNGDTASVISSLALGTTAAVGAGPGDYKINGAGTATNYTLTFIPGLLNISKALATFSLGSLSKVYGDAPRTFSPTLTGFTAADEAQARGIWGVSLTDSAALGAGRYTLDFVVKNASLAAFYSQFYDIAFNPGTLTVLKASLQLVARNVTTTFGDGGSTNGFDVFGLRNGDATSVIAGAALKSFTLFSNAAGGNYPITFSSAGTAANYEITTVDGVFKVQPKVLVYQAPTLTSPAGVIPTLNPAAQTLVAGGPQFSVVGYVPPGSASLRAGEEVTINLRIVPTGGATLADVTRSYSIEGNGGSLRFTEPPVGLTDPSLLTVSIGDGFTADLDPTPLKKKDVIRVDITEYKTPFGADDFAALISGSTTRLIGIMTDFKKSSAYLNDYDDSERGIIDAFINGTLSVDDLIGMMRGSPKIQGMLMPLFGSMAVDLIAGGAKTPAEKRLVYFMEQAAAEQRNAVAAKATERYNEWLARGVDNTTDALGLSTPYAGYTMHLLPDVVTGSQGDVLALLLGAGLGAGAAGATAGIALGKSTALAMAIFSKATWIAGKEVGTRVVAQVMSTAVGAAGPISVVVGVAVLITVIGINAIAQSDANRVAYEHVLERAAEAPTVNNGDNLYKFSLAAPKTAEDAAEILTSFTQIFSGAFGVK